MAPALTPTNVDFEAEIRQVQELLEDFASNAEKQTLRERVKALIPVVYRIRDLGSSLISPDDAGSGRERILLYLQSYPRQIIHGDELLVISGIGEWARRVRELRVQFGWWIYSGHTFSEIASEDPATAR